jgi:hypothetical protein
VTETPVDAGGEMVAAAAAVRRSRRVEVIAGRLAEVATIVVGSSLAITDRGENHLLAVVLAILVAPAVGQAATALAGRLRRPVVGWYLALLLRSGGGHVVLEVKDAESTRLGRQVSLAAAAAAALMAVWLTTHPAGGTLVFLVGLIALILLGAWLVVDQQAGPGARLSHARFDQLETGSDGLTWFGPRERERIRWDRSGQWRSATGSSAGGRPCGPSPAGGRRPPRATSSRARASRWTSFRSSRPPGPVPTSDVAVSPSSA